jgi:NADH-quinone oxidoreductase subunit L
MDWLLNTPGRLYVVGTLLPLTAFALLLASGALRALCRPFRQQGGAAATLYWALGGDTPARGGAYLATAFMALAAACGVAGLTLFLTDEHTGAEHAARWGERIDWLRLGPLDTAAPPTYEARYREWERRDESRGVPQPPAPPVALALELGYRIDHLTAVVFAMVTVVATLIFVFSLGYMQDETKEVVEDHEVTLAHAHTDSHSTHNTHSGSPASAEAGAEHAHLHRRGRFGRFFLYLSLFSFSMLNLVIADNLFQVFVSWELVGVCSFFLIGFYYERPSASRAANKAFIVNRVGDAGFLLGILIAWTYLGTLNFEEMQRRVRSPAADAHGNVALADKLVRVNVEAGGSRLVVPPRDAQGGGTHLALFPVSQVGHFDALGYSGHRGSPRDLPRPQTYTDFGAIPYSLFVLMGVGIFLGCAGKSAQVPLQTWLPDAMEGPTPVSALIHAATMVAAGVYLVGRCHPLFAPEVLLAIAYVGAATLFISATIALVQTDIKRVLAYSTCSQLGFMMLALGIGGWVAGLLHLITHAFFKALLFLCSGSVIHGCHHEQDLRKMGGLRSKMPLTAFTMLVGVLAIAGAPLLSGWYSKDMILSSALAFATVHPAHAALFVLPLLTAAMTAYYMFRLWFLAFTGPPRDAHVHTRAHESPSVMTVPLVVLAVFSVCVAWGWPLWSADASALGHVLEKAQPASVPADYFAERTKEHDVHTTAGLAALAAAVVGAGIAFAVFGRRQPSAEALHARGPAWYRFLVRKWYFDEAYDATLVKPTVALARAAAVADKRPSDTPPDAPGAKRLDLTLDGLLNGVGQLAAALGGLLRRAQTGRVRNYVAVLALTAAAMLGMLAVLAK